MAKVKTKVVESKKLNYIGIKQIGSFWYSNKDNYKKSFYSADGCAEYFNTGEVA